MLLHEQDQLIAMIPKLHYHPLQSHQLMWGELLSQRDEMALDDHLAIVEIKQFEE